MYSMHLNDTNQRRGSSYPVTIVTHVVEYVYVCHSNWTTYRSHEHSHVLFMLAVISVHIGKLPTEFGVYTPGDNVF